MIASVGVLMAGPVRAQGAGSGGRSGTAVSPCTDAPRPVGFVIDTVYGSLRESSQHALPDAYTTMLLRGLIQSFSPPSPLNVPVFSGPIHQQPHSLQTAPKHASSPVFLPESVSVAITGAVVFTVQHDGRLADAQLLTSTLSSAMDGQLLHAVIALDSTHLVPPLPDGTRGTSASFVFTATRAPDSMSTAEPLLATRMPVWIMERPPSMESGNPAPRYPQQAERDRVGDELLLSFVIDDHGRVRMETVRVLRARYREFLMAVLKVLPAWRFEPARISGCPVFARVQLPFSFRIPH